MKKIYFLYLLSIFTFTACQIKTEIKTVEPANLNTIKVGVFDKNGDSPYCITDAIEALKIDKDIEPRVISAAEIMLGETDDIDVFLFPGGGGRSETGSLGELGQQKIIDYVKNQGKGVVGICAGAYILSETPDYPSLDLSGGEAIDIEHDHRGHGLVKFSITENGTKIFPELTNKEIFSDIYYLDGQYNYQKIYRNFNIKDGIRLGLYNERKDKLFISYYNQKDLTLEKEQTAITTKFRPTIGKTEYLYEGNVIKSGIYGLSK